MYKMRDELLANLKTKQRSTLEFVCQTPNQFEELGLPAMINDFSQNFDVIPKPLLFAHMDKLKPENLQKVAEMSLKTDELIQFTATLQQFIKSNRDLIKLKSLSLIFDWFTKNLLSPELDLIADILSEISPELVTKACLQPKSPFTPTTPFMAKKDETESLLLKMKEPPRFCITCMCDLRKYHISIITRIFEEYLKITQFLHPFKKTGGFMGGYANEDGVTLQLDEYKRLQTGTQKLQEIGKKLSLLISTEDLWERKIDFNYDIEFVPQTANNVLTKRGRQQIKFGLAKSDVDAVPLMQTVRQADLANEEQYTKLKNVVSDYWGIMVVFTFLFFTLLVLIR